MAAPTSVKTDPSIPELMRSAAADVTVLISDQIELTKAELQVSAKTAGRAFGLLAAAAFIAIFLFLFLLLTLAFVLEAVGLPMWAAFGIVALILLITTVVLGLVGKKRAESIKPPERSKAQAELTAATFKGSVDSFKGSVESVPGVTP